MNKSISKFMSLVLRHHPEKAGLTLDKNGWVTIETLIDGVRSQHPEFDDKMLDEVVGTNDKKRFEYDVTGTMIRACQGHSVEIDLDLKPSEPPFVLYHGTVGRHLDSIMEKGLLRGDRRHVHLSADLETASKVGSRRGCPVLLEIEARRMWEHHYAFYISTNGVWLTHHVPATYIKVKES